MSASSTALAALPATRLLVEYARGTVSPVDVVDAVLERMAIAQSSLNCFSYEFADEARASALASEARWRNGEACGTLDGIPVTIKENLATAGTPLTLGSASFAGAAPQERNAPAADRMVEAGAVVVGKTTMPDFAMLFAGVSSLHGVTRSPWNRDWNVGGSSGGAAAAAAAGVGPLHSGSDMAGSLRVPAGWTGTTTLKPSWGRLPVEPAFTARTLGSMARTVDDVALHTSVMAGPDIRDFSALPPERLPWTSHGKPVRDDAVAGLRVALMLDAGCGVSCDPEIVEAIERAATRFTDAGAEVIPLAPFMTPQYLLAIEQFFMVKLWADFEPLPQERKQLMHPFLASWIPGAAKLSSADTMRMINTLQDMRRAAVLATADFDLVLSPVTPTATFPAEWPTPSGDTIGNAVDHVAFAAVYNFSEQPAGSINCGFTASAKPIGLQIAGRRFRDLDVLGAMRWYEAVRPADAHPDWNALDTSLYG